MAKARGEELENRQGSKTLGKLSFIPKAMGSHQMDFFFLLRSNMVRFRCIILPYYVRIVPELSPEEIDFLTLLNDETNTYTL